jgi:hypothetical protein
VAAANDELMHKASELNDDNARLRDELTSIEDEAAAAARRSDAAIALVIAERDSALRQLRRELKTLQGEASSAKIDHEYVVAEAAALSIKNKQITSLNAMDSATVGRAAALVTFICVLFRVAP